MFHEDNKFMYYTPLGNVFHAIVSVIAVKIQLSSPSMVRRSFSWPGILCHIKFSSDGSPKSQVITLVYSCWFQ